MSLILKVCKILYDVHEYNFLRGFIDYLQFKMVYDTKNMVRVDLKVNRL
jgi:hypothetical protein